MSITETIREIDKEIRYDRFAACYGCGVPQRACNTWEDNGAGGYRKSQERECQYGGVLTGSIYGIVIGCPDIGMQWIERLQALGVDGVSMTYAGYLGRMQKLETVQASNLAAEFCWITRAVAAQILGRE